ncbi:MAG TPA: serine/threonine-protein kinase [Vicinamibacterales bacterium]|nr:serine/threonine-protein kinase [Vicinamibacterales bacterium]
MESITPDLWRRIKAVASAALDLDLPSRTAYVDRACAGDVRLRAEVESLLASTVAATPYFETPGGGGTATLFSSGSRIGPYRLVRELATGGMGSVYLAEREDGDFRQRVAIKIVRGGFANSFLLERFREERRILASLEHPNIARLLDGGATDTGLPYVVMEFVEGESIDQFCARRRLSLSERLAVFKQVCAAVQYAHQHLVVHRDIKAANILVTDDGTPKLLDFGIAKLLDPGAARGFAPHTTVRVMTPESASPEQVSGRPVTVASDVYALGVLLYRVLTGASPYRVASDRETDLIRAVCEETPEPPSRNPGGKGNRIPADVDMIVMKALRKEPERRYESPGQLSDDIQRFLDGRPVLASPDSIRYRAGKFVRRHRVAVVAAAAVALALIAGVGATVWQARVAERERMRAQRQFNAVRGLAQSVLGELHDAVQKLPGSTVAQEILLRRGTEYLDALSAEVKNDDALRREVADGYVRLATVQGMNGLPNLGDREATRASLRKAVALFEPMADVSRGDVGDRLNLAASLARLSSIEPDRKTADEDLHKAGAIMDALSPGERSTPYSLSMRQVVWEIAANSRLRVRDYEGARSSYERIREAAEEGLRLTPGNLDASRNLSLVYKQLGATLEMLKRLPEAMPLYEKALDLDRRRVAMDPSRPIWRLDLSFSYGAIGAALMSEDDLRGARARYEEAVALREAVVAQDPEEDFAKIALARGYERLATIRGRLGDVAAALDYNRRRIRVYRDRLDAHPERDNVWREYAQAAFDAARASLDLLESSRSRRLAPQVGGFLDDLAAVQKRWARGKHAGALPPAADALKKERERAERLVAEGK